LGTYKVNDMISFSAGLADSSNVGTIVQPINGRSEQESQKTYMGSVSFTAPDSAGFMKGATLNAGIIQSVSGNLVGKVAGGFGLNTFGSTSYYLGATVPTPLNALKVGAAFDYIDLHSAHNGVGTGNSDNSAMVVGLYANYQANDKLSFNARAERVEDNNAGFTPGSAEVDEVTLTAQYQLWANVLSRVEFRWDHSGPQNGFPINAGAYDSSPIGSNYNGGAAIHNNAFLLALNLIYQF